MTQTRRKKKKKESLVLPKHVPPAHLKPINMNPLSIFAYLHIFSANVHFHQLIVKVHLLILTHRLKDDPKNRLEVVHLTFETSQPTRSLQAHWRTELQRETVQRERAWTIQSCQYRSPARLLHTVDREPLGKLHDEVTRFCFVFLEEK